MHSEKLGSIAGYRIPDRRPTGRASQPRGAARRLRRKPAGELKPEPARPPGRSECVREGEANERSGWDRRGLEASTENASVVPFSRPTRDAIAAVISGVVERTLRTRVVAEPWDLEAERQLRPFAFALAPEEVWKGAKFERSFTTSFGRAWEQIAQLVAQDKHDHAERDSRVIGTLHQGQLTAIQTILNQLERRTRQPDWDAEFEEVMAARTGPVVETAVIADLDVWDDAQPHQFFEIKAPKPNSDQTKVSKEKMLKLAAMHDDRTCAFFALPYNPYPSRAEYAHSYPKRRFNMSTDEVVLMGRHFWDKVGASGTWDDLMALVEEIGEDHRNRIRREYFGMR